MTEVDGQPEFLSQRYLTGEHLAAIGIVAAEWSLLENVLRSMIASATKSEGRWVSMLSRGAGGRDLASIFIGLLDAQVLVQHQANALRPILAQIDPLAAERNQFVHAIWGADATIEELMSGDMRPRQSASGVVMTGQGKRLTTITVGPELILDTARKIARIRHDLWACLDKAEP